eukprot:symbB.v1.2.018691.t1/scaffold1410.1/size216244/17
MLRRSPVRRSNELDVAPFLPWRLWLETISHKLQAKKKFALCTLNFEQTAAAEDVESGGEPSVALGRGRQAAEETEALALQSLHARLQALTSFDLDKIFIDFRSLQFYYLFH